MDSITNVKGVISMTSDNLHIENSGEEYILSFIVMKPVWL